MVKQLNENEFKDVLASGKKFFVDFYADWCGPCRAMGPVVDEVSEELTNVDFYKVNVDEAENLAEALMITNIPCFMVFEEGKLQKKFVGMMSKESLIEKI